MSRRICLPVAGLLIATLAYLLPGCDELVTEVTDRVQWVRADFEVDQEFGCAPFTVQFNENSGGEPDSFQWKFGDGGSSFERNPEHTYNTAGVFTCTLTVFNTETESQDTEIKKRLIVVGTTVNDFSADTTVGCPGLAITFSPAEYGGVDSFKWDFGDGSGVSTDTSPTHVYDSVGYHTVTLTAFGSCGTKAISYDSLIEIGDCPDVKFTATPSGGCVPLKVIFRDESDAGASHAMEQWDWDFGNDSTSDNQDDSTTYVDTGTYVVTLTASSGGGTSTAIDTIFVYDTAMAAFSAESPTTGCYLPTRQFQVKFKNDSRADTSWTWDFGDGTISYDSAPVHAYINPGFYTVKLRVEGLCGIDSIIKDSFVVLSDTLEYAAFAIAPETIGDTATIFTFTDQSGGIITGWSWDFGDDSTATGDSVTHTYGYADTFQVRLTISNACGSVEVIDTVIVTE